MSDVPIFKQKKNLMSNSDIDVCGSTVASAMLPLLVCPVPVVCMFTGLTFTLFGGGSDTVVAGAVVTICSSSAVNAYSQPMSCI